MNTTKIYAESNNSGTPSSASQTPMAVPTSKMQLSPLTGEVGVGESLQSPLAAKHKKKKKIKKVVKTDAESGFANARNQLTMSQPDGAPPLYELTNNADVEPGSAPYGSTSATPPLKMSGPPSSSSKSSPGLLTDL